MASIKQRIGAFLIAGLTISAAVPVLADDRQPAGGRSDSGRAQGGRSDGARSNPGRADGGQPANGRQAVPRESVAPGPQRPAGAAVPRVGSPVVHPQHYPARPSRPYTYRPSYGYRPYSGYYGYRPYLYAPAVGLNLYFGRPYVPYGAYGPAGAYGYYSVVPGRTYGSVRIADAPQDAEVYVDGYYAGLVGDYNGNVNLEAGPHHIEITVPGDAPIAFDVRVEPGQSITYRAYAGRP